MRRALTAGVALSGLGIAGYLTVVHYTGGAPVCAISHGCETVQHSGYSTLAGVPVALLGIVGYLGILLSLLRNGDDARMTGAFMALLGFGFSAWLTYTEIARIHAICIWCVGSAICMTVLAVLSVSAVVAAPPRADRPRARAE
jgi:uncharacterized membrane protein